MLYNEITVKETQTTNGGDYMAKENYFIIQTYDEEKEMFVQRHYWIAGKHFFSSVEFEDGTTENKKRISEKEYVNALEEYFCA